MVKNYFLLDSGDLQKLECFGEYVLARPCSQALWQRHLGEEAWRAADASFSRDGAQGWHKRGTLASEWVMQLLDLKFKISLTDFGHVGIFPEHSSLWQEMGDLIGARREKVSILNLFAYSGGATLAAARAGAKVCHLDASKGMVSWARENAVLNRLDKAPIRWIVDDVIKFLKREIKRGIFYDGLIIDPPSFGRGNKGEVFKIEKQILPLLQLCRRVLAPKPLFVFFTSHTPGMTPQVLHHLLSQMMQGTCGDVQAREMLLPAEKSFAIPSGSMAKWVETP